MIFARASFVKVRWRHLVNVLRHVGHTLTFLSESLLPHAPHIHDDDIDDPMTNRMNAKMKATSQPAKGATTKKSPMAKS
jgi:hypothetical protein